MCRSPAHLTSEVGAWLLATAFRVDRGLRTHEGVSTHLFNLATVGDELFERIEAENLGHLSLQGGQNGHRNPDFQIIVHVDMELVWGESPSKLVDERIDSDTSRILLQQAQKRENFSLQLVVVHSEPFT